MSQDSKIKELTTGAKVFLGLYAALLIWLWFSFITFRPHAESDFGTITGILESAQEQITPNRAGESGKLDIRLKGQNLNYCVPMDGYLEYFRREAFFREVPLGSTIELKALKSDIASPSLGFLSTRPTIFVHEVRVGGQVYCSLQDRIAWEKKNHWWQLGVALILSGFYLCFLINIIKNRKAERTLVKYPAHPKA